MFDKNLLFHDAEALDDNGNSSGLAVYKTPVDGITVEVVVTAASGTTPTLDLKVQESDDDSTYNDVAVFPQITGTGRWARKVQSKKAYLRLARTVGGTTPSFTVTAGISTGFERDMGA